MQCRYNLQLHDMMKYKSYICTFARDHCRDPGADEMIILRWILKKWDVGVRTGSSCLRIGTDGGHLLMR